MVAATGNCTLQKIVQLSGGDGTEVYIVDLDDWGTISNAEAPIDDLDAQFAI